jgi:ribosomal protein S18 acetylase RimI-like enzyme
MTLTVNVATPDQAKRIGEFMLEAWHEAGPTALGWTGATESNIASISSEKFLSELLSNPACKMFICEDEGKKIVGFALNRKITEENVELAGIIVLQDSLGRGIGSALIMEAKKSAFASHFRRMLGKSNSRTLSLS